MSRIVLTLIISLATLICQAQEHLQFLDIPIAGDVEQFANKLVSEKGFKIEDRNDYEEKLFKVEAKILSGNFEVFDECTVVVRKIEGVSETSSVAVYIDSLKSLNGEFEKLIDVYDKKYGKHTSFWLDNKWEVNGGRIMAGSQDGGYYIIFMNKPEAEIRDAFLNAAKEIKDLLEANKEKQTVKEICGIPFGSSYPVTKGLLYNKYGSPEYYPDNTIISYKNKTYAGISFDSIHFLFQSDGVNSYFNGCVFILDAKSLNEAKKNQELLYKKLSEKYTIVDNTDNNGNKIYFGGYPPTPNDVCGFSIEILKYDSELAKLYSPYATRLAYGRYNYVKEEF